MLAAPEGKRVKRGRLANSPRCSPRAFPALALCSSLRMLPGYKTPPSHRGRAAPRHGNRFRGFRRVSADDEAQKCPVGEKRDGDEEKPVPKHGHMLMVEADGGGPHLPRDLPARAVLAGEGVDLEFGAHGRERMPGVREFSALPGVREFSTLPGDISALESLEGGDVGSLSLVEEQHAMLRMLRFL